MDQSERPSHYQVPQSRGICKFHLRGICKFGNNCRNMHPPRQQMSFQKLPRNDDYPEVLQYREMEATASSEKREDNEIESAALREESSSKICGICFDFILQKQNKRQQIFGILPNCNHCFCFTCIRRWRQSKDFDLEVAKGCPECRIYSDFVYPSTVWFELKQHKEQFIAKEKSKMHEIDCKYFRKGRGKCPFGNKCLYLHALPNGRRLDVGPPRSRRRRVSNEYQIEVFHEILHWLNDEDEYFSDDNTMTRQMHEDQDILEIIALDRIINSNSEECTFFT